MGKYYLIEISDGDSKIKGRAIYEFETLAEAVANFHSKLGAAMKSELYASEFVMVIDDGGSVWRTEKHTK